MRLSVVDSSFKRLPRAYQYHDYIRNLRHQHEKSCFAFNAKLEKYWLSIMQIGDLIRE